jgi:DNA (cytosine-5)-methyltransferase 1|tara:strand:+ start:1059 stop:1883 length:825 start_codon:yes stop_codon:yes gene_type:complete
MDHERIMQKLMGYSICSGIGGLDIAFQSEYIGGQTIGYCEYDRYCQNVLWRRMQDGWLDNAAIWPDLYTLEKSIVGNVDVLYGGIPCQPHSQAGKRAGVNDSRDLWPTTFELVREIRPKLFWLENVAGITLGTPVQGAYVYRIFNDLSKIGYEFRWTTVRASDIGAPHRRERFFLLAYTTALGDTYGQGRIRRLLAYSTGKGISFPPGPEDSGRWKNIIKQYPQLAPAIEPRIRTGPDGLTAGLDKYRRKGLAALGNGVVPQQAILAWQILTSD